MEILFLFRKISQNFLSGAHDYINLFKVGICTTKTLNFAVIAMFRIADDYYKAIMSGLMRPLDSRVLIDDIYDSW